MKTYQVVGVYEARPAHYPSNSLCSLQVFVAVLFVVYCMQSNSPLLWILSQKYLTLLHDIQELIHYYCVCVHAHIVIFTFLHCCLFISYTQILSWLTMFPKIPFTIMGNSFLLNDDFHRTNPLSIKIKVRVLWFYWAHYQTTDSQHSLPGVW